MKDSKDLKKSVNYLSLYFQIIGNTFVSVFGFSFIGYKLSNFFENNWIFLIAILLGVATSFYLIYKILFVKEKDDE